MKGVVLAAVIFLAGPTVIAADSLPPPKWQPSVHKVVEEHFRALNECDWERLMAQYRKDVEVLLPNGALVKGRNKVGDLFRDFCRPRPDGFKGLTFTAESKFLVGNTLNVTWRAEADFLAEPYKGSDAYVTRGGLLAAQVTTFDPSQLKFRNTSRAGSP